MASFVLLNAHSNAMKTKYFVQDKEPKMAVKIVPLVNQKLLSNGGVIKEHTALEFALQYVITMKSCAQPSMILVTGVQLDLSVDQKK